MKWTILAIVVIGAAYLYSYIDQPMPIYDEKIPIEQYTICEELVKEVTIEQEFTARQDTIKGIRIKCKTFVERPNAKIQYSMTDKETGQVVAKGEVDAEKIKTSKFHEFEFESIPHCEGKTFTFSLSSPDGVTSESVGVYKTPSTKRDTNLLINGEKTEGTLVFRTVTHLFSIETFGVVLCFIAYIILFIKILYKFFK